MSISKNEKKGPVAYRLTDCISELFNTHEMLSVFFFREKAALQLCPLIIQ